MPKYYEEIERTGVEIEEVRNCTKNLAGNWNFSIVYRYKCPFCQHKYNMSPGTETFPEGVHTIKTKHQCTNSKCRKEYDVVLKLKSDFTELKNTEKEKKKKQLEGFNKSSQQETQATNLATFQNDIFYVCIQRGKYSFCGSYNFWNFYGLFFFEQS